MSIKISVYGYEKDTFCDYIKNKNRHKDCVKISLADPIYDIMYEAQKICNLPQIKDRKFLQFIGENWGINIDENLWVDLAISKSENHDISLISDLRYIHEFQTLKKDGWFNVKIESNKNHERIVSETELDILHKLSWDYVIVNNGTLEEFYEKIDIMLTKFFHL
jgi:hypothetical protein